ncbi:hypothetical protein LTR35_010403 [Friedmanniomyces endolithicus]|nr:hypothetical protein LTR35_010403 [Friedmanniomyces endolithicus]KAK0294223.1 hypothetical protein LTS00_007198 [Friedmanniomyces endolithicus]KAK1003313.1 hypothetical protein LTR54_007826 [Friedmanniomyces endolithicus]
MRSGRLLMDKLQHQAEGYQARVPWIRRLPASAVAIVLPLMVVNISLWIACAIILSYHPGLVSTAVIAWTLGLRHAIDADHISAIDLMTSRLVASGQRPVTVGTFFSLSHLTIVIATCIIVAASSAAISDRFGAFSDVGGIIGGSVSAAVGGGSGVEVRDCAGVEGAGEEGSAYSRPAKTFGWDAWTKRNTKR